MPELEATTPDYNAASGNKIVDTCQGYHNDVSAQYQYKEKNPSCLTSEQDDSAESAICDNWLVITA